MGLGEKLGNSAIYRQLYACMLPGSGADTPYMALQMIFDAAGQSDRLVHLLLGVMLVPDMGFSLLYTSYKLKGGQIKV